MTSIEEQMAATDDAIVADALAILAREHFEHVMADMPGRVLDVTTQTMQAAWAARNRLSSMTTGGGRAMLPPKRAYAMTPSSVVSNCPTCIGLGCGECCGTGRA